MKLINFRERAESSPGSQSRPLWRYYTKSQKHKSERGFLCSKNYFYTPTRKAQRSESQVFPEVVGRENSACDRRQRGWGLGKRVKGRRRVREEVLVQISAWCLNPILSSKAVMGEKKRVICPPHKNFQQKWENQSGKDTRLNIAGGRCQSG